MWVQLIILPVLLLGFIISVTILGTYIEYKIRKEYEELCSKSKGKEASSDNVSSGNASSDNIDININCFIDNK